MPRICSMIHLPRFTGDVRVGFDVIVSTLACVSTPPRRRSPASRAGTHPLSMSFDAIMLRHTLIQECVVGVEQVQDAAIFAHDRCKKQFGLPFHRSPQDYSSKPLNRLRSGEATRQVADLQPLAGEIFHQRLRARIGQHPPHLRGQHIFVETGVPCSARRNNSSSGMLLHKKYDSREAN